MVNDAAGSGIEQAALRYNGLAAGLIDSRTGDAAAKCRGLGCQMLKTRNVLPAYCCRWTSVRWGGQAAPQAVLPPSTQVRRVRTADATSLGIDLCWDSTPSLQQRENQGRFQVSSRH